MFIRIGKAAERLRGDSSTASKETIRRWVAEGLLAGVEIGERRDLWIDLGSIEEFEGRVERERAERAAATGARASVAAGDGRD